MAALGFVTYPALRPWSSESGREGAEALASVWWPVSHVLAMAGLVALAVLLRHAGARARSTESLAWASVALLLPYYGAEAFGGHAMGSVAIESGDVAVLDALESFRFDPVPLTMFAGGLVLLAVVGVRLGLLHRDAPVQARVGSALAGAGLATFLPQFFLPGPARIAHGLVLGSGFALLALSALREHEQPGR